MSVLALPARESLQAMIAPPTASVVMAGVSCWSEAVETGTFTVGLAGPAAEGGGGGGEAQREQHTGGADPGRDGGRHGRSPRSLPGPAVGLCAGSAGIARALRFRDAADEDGASWRTLWADGEPKVDERTEGSSSRQVLLQS